MRMKGMVVMFALLASTAFAQDLMPKSEISAGYTFGSLDQGSGFSRANSNGWHTGMNTYLSKWLGIEGNFAGLGHTDSASITDPISGNTVSSSVSQKHLTFVAGPRIGFGSSKFNPYFHTLFGMDRMSIDSKSNVLGQAIDISASDTGLAWVLGGGTEIGMTPHFALNTGFDYLMTRHGSASQNNVRLMLGVAYRFGGSAGGK